MAKAEASVEEFSFNHNGSSQSIAGFYPFLDIHDEIEKENEYKKVSFLLNNEAMKKIHQTLYLSVISNLMRTHPQGAFLTIMANDSALADSKIWELANLVSP